MKQTPSSIFVLGQSLRAVDRLAEVGDKSVTPAPDFIAEDAKVAGPVAPDGTSSDDPSLLRVGIRHRRTLDRVAALRHVYLKRRVIDVEGAPAFEQRHHGLEDLAIESHGVTSGAQGEPVQVDGDEG
jgi:hypothetical protein